MYTVDNAVIMAAGTSSRFAPLSYEMPKGLITVKGEVLIERQIRQLKQAGINEIIIVVGYKKECFEYLKDKYDVILVENNDYATRNNNASIYVARKYFKNTYLCSSDNYFSENPFTKEVDESYYAAVYANGDTNEWCIDTDENDYINSVKVGGKNKWYMLGHTFWSEDFSKKFIKILEEVYNDEKTTNLLWESIYIDHLDELKMKIKKYYNEIVFEFDTLGELREFDKSYIDDTHSVILKSLCEHFKCKERDIVDINVYKEKDNTASGFYFTIENKQYKYSYVDQQINLI